MKDTCVSVLKSVFWLLCGSDMVSTKPGPHHTGQCTRKQRYVNNDQLKDEVRLAFQTITPVMLQLKNTRTWRGINLCIE
ncbi:hypothetical protein ANN_19658 [Periplaneta americana]|uniref:Secreted protein n=1 Tax=Periplaneta americana TaxID=6978 RepID=A0ABQ8SAQ0_PERAM|nr:hypothetical protein ANN_19658 [Periplaneta americana]